MKKEPKLSKLVNNDSKTSVVKKFNSLCNNSNLYISFSGRDSGNSTEIATYLMKDNDNLIKFKDISYNSCSNCDYECFNDKCKYRQDDIYALLDSIKTYKKVVFVVPMYCNNPSSLYFIINERMQDYFYHNSNQWDSFISKLYFVCIYGSDSESPDFVRIFNNLVNNQSRILKIERHKYDLKMNDMILNNRQIVALIDDFKKNLD